MRRYIEGQSNSKGFIIDLDRDVVESVRRLADYVESTSRERFMELIFSLLLYSILVEDTQETVDGFERIVVYFNHHDESSTPKIWGEFLTLSNVFYNRYVNHDDLREFLKDLVPGEYRFSPEEMFDITVSKKGPYIVIR